jgi:hypothetical protein
MDNVQNCDGYINIASFQTYKSYIHYLSHTYIKTSTNYFLPFIRLGFR